MPTDMSTLWANNVSLDAHSKDKYKLSVVRTTVYLSLSLTHSHSHTLKIKLYAYTHILTHNIMHMHIHTSQLTRQNISLDEVLPLSSCLEPLLQLCNGGREGGREGERERERELSISFLVHRLLCERPLRNTSCNTS